MSEALMPALFLGHGSPMNAIEDTAFRRGWEDCAKSLPRPMRCSLVAALIGLDDGLKQVQCRVLRLGRRITSLTSRRTAPMGPAAFFASSCMILKNVPIW